MTIDFGQLAVAGAATCSYACTSMIVQRLVIVRRRRQIRNEARFMANLVEGVRHGSIGSLSDATVLYRQCCSLPPDGVVSPHRLAFFVRRAAARQRRRLVMMTGRGDAVDLRPMLESSLGILRRLQRDSHAAMMEALVRKARVAEGDRGAVRLEFESQSAQLVDQLRGDAQARPKRRGGQRRFASYFWRGVTGAGCIVFVQLALVVWHVLH
jgi:hypothetical protein